MVNAASPIDLTLYGIVMLVRPVHPENAQEPIDVTLPSVGITLALHPAINVLVAVSIRQLPEE